MNRRFGFRCFGGMLTRAVDRVGKNVRSQQAAEAGDGRCETRKVGALS